MEREYKQKEEDRRKSKIKDLIKRCKTIDEKQLSQIMQDKESIETIVIYNKNEANVIVINNAPYKIEPIDDNFELGDDILEGLSNLKRLGLYECSRDYCTDYSIQKLFKLTHLACVSSPGITNDSLNRLQDLIYLQIFESRISGDLLKGIAIKQFNMDDEFKLWDEEGII